MSNLIEKILTNELVEASKIFEAEMNYIKENKLFESKRLLAAEIHEGRGGFTYTAAEIKSDLESGKKRRASDVLGLHPYDKAQEEKKKRESKRTSKSGTKFIKKKISDKDKKETEPKSTPSTPDVKPTTPDVKPTTPDVKPKQSWGRRNLNTLMGRDPDYDPNSPENQRGGRGGKAARGAVRGASKLIGDFMSGLEEDVRPKKRMIVKKRKTILVTRKTDPHARMGGGVQRIDKDKYNPKIHNLAVEE